MLRTMFPRCARSAFRPMTLRFYSNKVDAVSPVTAHGKNPTIRYTDNHEWIAVHEDDVGFVGITKYAADALGDVTYADIAETPFEVEPQGTIGSVESVKSASDLYSPVTGTVIESNQELIGNPQLVNSSPMGAAWFAKIKLADRKELEQLMNYEQYEAYLSEAD